eukprot:CAMPEP_0196599570 /NCGR_PEP_ID=MMETSP1081-20130531/94929_1 /TAXON_ID=36882 /ORGANISM="Pyramimonas amylifera, Strain CCMP720" /LENGTH=63 /DNA_ID=CAMNT_0041925353 /DNA_START=1208 /DNA_END=1399 /DNA_ORIENTATION=+
MTPRDFEYPDDPVLDRPASPSAGWACSSQDGTLAAMFSDSASVVAGVGESEWREWREWREWEE